MAVIYKEGDKIVTGPARIKTHWGRLPWGGEGSEGSSFNPSEVPRNRSGYSSIDFDYEAYYSTYEWMPDGQGSGAWSRAEQVQGPLNSSRSSAEAQGRQAALSSIGDSKVGDGFFNSLDDVPSHLSAETTDYGAPNLGKDDFFQASGERKDIGDVMTLLQDTFPESELTKDRTKLQKLIENQLPSLGDIDQKESQFLAEQYGGTYQQETSFDFNDDGKVDSIDIAAAPAGFRDQISQSILGATGATSGTGDIDISFADSLSGQQAGQTLDASMSKVQQGAQSLGQQMQGVYGGGGASMRSQIGGSKAVSEAFESAQDQYGLSKQQAGLKSRQGMYGLEKERFDEGAFSDFISQFADAG